MIHGKLPDVQINGVSKALLHLVPNTTQIAEDVITGEKRAISREQEQSEPLAASPVDKERFMSYVRRIANSLPAPCRITIQPAGTPLQIEPAK